jgi:hypothetical protein
MEHGRLVPGVLGGLVLGISTIILILVHRDK